MKTLIVQGDGIATHALAELDGQTLLQVAKTPNLDHLASQAEFGFLTLPSEGQALSSAVTQLALLGYDPSKYFSGLGPFEAASLEVVLDSHDVAFLCHFVTLNSDHGHGDSKKLGPHLILEDEEAGGIDTEEARDLIDAVNEQLGSETIQFYAGDGHRHVMVWIGSTTRSGCQNPRAARGRSIEPFLPSGKGADVVKELMEASRILLRRHPVNLERVQAGLKPANCLWLWGPGKAIELPNWRERWSTSNMTISTSGIHRGIAICAGGDVLNPRDHTDNDQMEVSASVQLCLQALQSKDFLYLHVPMPYRDHTTDIQLAVNAIETFDEQVIGPLLQSSIERGDCRILVACNHADEHITTSLPTLTPYAFLEKSGKSNATARTTFDEIHAGKGPGRDATRVVTRVLSN